MHVCVAIIGFRDASDVAECLGALEQSTHRDFEVVICENGGAAAYAELTNMIPDRLAGGQIVRTIDAGRNLGFAGGVNVCMKASPHSDSWWILNPDTLPAPDAMAFLVERLEAGDCDAVGLTVRMADGRIGVFGGLWQKWIGRAVSIGKGTPSGDPVPGDIERRQNYLSGASMLIGRRFVEVAGFMREDYFLYCEEIEWCLRALKRGLRLGFAPKAIVIHNQSRTMENFKTKRPRGALPVYFSERNRILLTKDVFPRLLLPVVVVGIPLLIYKRWLRGNWRLFLYGVRGYWAGICGQRGVPAWLEG